MKNSILTHLQSQISLTSILKLDLKSSFIIFIIIFSIPVFSQVVFQDFAPDKEFVNRKSFELDINNDGNNDCKLAYYFCDDGFSWVNSYSIRTYEGCKVAIENDSVAAILQGETIDANLNWSDSTLLYIQYIRESSSYTFYGNWRDVREGFIALKLNIDGEDHYAWIRLHFNNIEMNYKMWAADCAYNENAESGIIAGQSIPLPATSVYIEDINDNSNGSDIKFSFTKAVEESLFTEYRVILAKAGDESASDVNIMSQLNSERYFSIEIPPNDSSFAITDSLLAETVDKDGDAIEKFSEYQAYVLNIGNIAALNMLSAPSEVLSLQSYIDAIDVPYAKDDGNNNTSGDIRVSFETDISTEFILEFRAFIIPFSDTASLNAQDAWNLPEVYFTSIPIQDENNYEIHLKSGQLDIFSNPIEVQKDYQVQILSVPDSSNCRTPVISVPSRRFYLDTFDSFYAGQKEGDGVFWYECDSLFAPFTYINGNNYYHGSETYEIDLNRDGIDDISVYGNNNGSSGGQSWRTYRFTPLNENKVLTSDEPEHGNWIEILNQGYAINENYHWNDQRSILTNRYSNVCGTGYDSGFYHHPEHTTNEYYIAFLINKDGVSQFAWLKLYASEYLEYGFIDNTTGLTESNNHHTFHIFPNPAKSKLYFQSSNSFDTGANMSVSVFNSMGIQMEEFDLSNAKMEKDISSYSSGMYFCVIKENGAILETHKVLIE